MNWLHLEEVLREYEAYLLEASKRNMPSYYELRNNIKFNLQVGDNFYEIVFAAPQYWKWAEDGRRPGKMPPVSAIADWVTRRKIAPYSNKNGKLPTTNQLAFAIAKKIGRDGTTGIHFLEKSIDEQKSYWDDKISEAISNDIIAELDSFFNNPIWSVK